MDARPTTPPGRRLLAISWAMPPLLAPRAIQVSRSLAALETLGWDITTISTGVLPMDRSATSDPSLSRVTRGSYRRITAVPPWPLRSKTSYAIFGRFKQALKHLTGGSDQRISNWSEFPWQYSATAMAKRLLAEKRFAALITFAQPWVDHIIGLHLHRATDVPWVAHFSDPWVDNPLLDKRDKRLPRWRTEEEAVVSEATAVIFTNDFTLDMVMSKYPASWRAKAIAIPHGFDRTLLGVLPPASRTNRLRMVHAGSFYRQRTPLPLLDALDIVRRTVPIYEQLEVLFVGADNERYAEVARKLGLNGLVSFRPPVPYVESAELSQNAGVLLVIDAPAERSMFLPSKLIDYLVFEKPILGITPLEGCSADLLRRLDCPVVAPDDVQGVAAAITSLLHAWRAGTLAISPAFRSVAQEFDIAETTRPLHSLLQQVASPC